MGGGSQSSKNSSGPSPQQLSAQTNQLNATSPILSMIANQLMEALRTGGVGAQIPIAQRAVEAGRNAAATTSRQTQEGLAREGVTGPYARQVQENVNQQGDFNVSQITPQMMQSLFQMAADYGLMRGSPIWGTPQQSGKSSGWSFNL